MATWVRFNRNGNTHLGTLSGEEILICSNALFEAPVTTGETVELSRVELLAPCQPNSILALWNNFHERAEGEGLTIPVSPL